MLIDYRAVDEPLTFWYPIHVLQYG